MNSGEQKVCQNCKTPFVIDASDFKFYEKISAPKGRDLASGGQVPPPTFCPDCRSQMRSLFRNESIFYKRTCDFSGREIISIYSQDKPFKVYDQNIWWSDAWDPLEYGKEYDFSKPFLNNSKSSS